MTDLREVRTEAVEDLLKAVYTLQQETDPVPTTVLAKALDISAPSVTDMVKRLADPKNHAPLLDHRPYYGVRLTPLGEKIALEVIRHHRLLELYLSQALGYSWDEVHEEADRLEHVISEQFEDRIAAVLGYPEIDPHGDPIPPRDATGVPVINAIPLTEVPTGEPVTVVRIIDQTEPVLRYLSELGLKPGVSISVLEKSPLNDTVTTAINGVAHTLSATVAHAVLTHAQPPAAHPTESASNE